MNLNSRIISDSLEVVVALSDLGQFGVRRPAIVGAFSLPFSRLIPNFNNESTFMKHLLRKIFFWDEPAQGALLGLTTLT